MLPVAPGPAPTAQSESGVLLDVQANTHIHANPELKDVKLWQVHTLLKGLEKIAASADIPMLVAGDFNSVPGRSAPPARLPRPPLPLGVLRWRSSSGGAPWLV
jgi:endonuclease/exonuclease/phosphatase family metal-dependent hydrolase